MRISSEGNIPNYALLTIYYTIQGHFTSQSDFAAILCSLIEAWSTPYIEAGGDDNEPANSMDLSQC